MSREEIFSVHLQYLDEIKRQINLANACLNNGFVDRASEYLQRAIEIARNWQVFIQEESEAIA